MRKRLLSLFWLTLLCFAIPQAVFANTLPSRWEGTSGHELRTAEDCPIQVKKERLSFRIDSRKRNYTARATITAAYSLYNPTDETCRFPAVFPVVLTDGQETPDSGTILLNGEPLPFDMQEAYYSEQEIWDGLTAVQLLEDAFAENIWNDDISGKDNIRVLLLTFELELPPGETTELQVNTITQAFMEQDRVFTYIPVETRYTFYYYLSPAQYWKSFEDIAIDLRLLLPWRIAVFLLSGPAGGGISITAKPCRREN